MFDALSHAAMLNPDPLIEGEEEENLGNDITAIDNNENSAGFIFNGEEVRLGASQAATLAQSGIRFHRASGAAFDRESIPRW